MGFAQAYPDDIPTGSTIFEAHGIDPAMWEPQELGTQNLFLEQDRKIKSYNLVVRNQTFWTTYNLRVTPKKH